MLKTLILVIRPSMEPNKSKKAQSCVAWRGIVIFYFAKVWKSHALVWMSDLHFSLCIFGPSLSPIERDLFKEHF